MGTFHVIASDVLFQGNMIFRSVMAVLLFLIISQQVILFFSFSIFFVVNS